MIRVRGTIRFSLANILRNHWDDFVAKYPSLRPAVRENVRRVLQCRTPALGCHVYRCQTCDHLAVVPHSCKSRFCPTCGKHATDVWTDTLLSELLDVPYHHLVLAVPHELRSILAWNRQVGLSILFEAAVASIQDWARDVMGMRCGIIAVLHTFGSDLKFHPHIHLIVTGGGLSLDGSRWIATRPNFLMAHGGLKKRWRYNVISRLRQAHKDGKLRFPDKADYLRVYKHFNKVLRTAYAKTWYAHIGASLQDPRFAVGYIARYTKRAVLAEYRITHYDGRTVRFVYRDYAQGSRTAYRSMGVLSFILRLTQHIPDKGFQMVRHAGLFANRWKNHYLTQAKAALGKNNPPTAPASAVLDWQATPATPLSLQPWRARQLDYRGKDPLVCPHCQTPLQLDEILFGNHAAIARLFVLAGVPLTPQRE